MGLIELEPHRILDTTVNYVTGTPYHPEHIVAQPIHTNGESGISTEVKTTLFSLIPQIDATLAEHALTSHTFVERVYPSDSQLPRTIVQTIADIVTTNPEAHVVSLLWGGIPQFIHIREELANRGLSTHERTSLIRISGSVGTSVRAAHIENTLPEAVVSSPTLVLHDDVIDTANHAASLIQARLRFAHTDTSPIEKVQARLSTRAFTDPFSMDSDTYKVLATQARESGVVFAVPFYKNGPFLKALIDEATGTKKTSHAQWAAMQIQFAQQAFLFDQSRWLMGEGLDTDIYGSRILPHVMHRLRQYNSAVQTPTTHNVLEALPSIKLRIGSFIHGLIALDERRKEEFFDWVGLTLGELLGNKDSKHFHTIFTSA